MIRRRLNQRLGFTLIELVMTIALAGLVMLMIMPFFQSGITINPSHQPSQRLQEAMTVQRAMECINGTYGRVNPKNSAALQTLSTDIGTVGSSYTGTCTGTGVGRFGVYTVLENQFVTFDNHGNEQAGGTMVLKVTIRSTTTPGNQITQLFTVQVPH